MAIIPQFWSCWDGYPGLSAALQCPQHLTSPDFTCGRGRIDWEYIHRTYSVETKNDNTVTNDNVQGGFCVSTHTA